MDRGSTYMDDSNLQNVNDEDMESKEKPKVTYICGGIINPYFICFNFRVWQGQQTR